MDASNKYVGKVLISGGIFFYGLTTRLPFLLFWQLLDFRQHTCQDTLLLPLPFAAKEGAYRDVVMGWLNREEHSQPTTSIHMVMAVMAVTGAATSLPHAWTAEDF